MNWNEIKAKVSQKTEIKEIDKDTFKFDFNGKQYKFHKFSVPEGFIVDNKTMRYYNGKIVVYKKIKNRWKLWI